MNFTTSTVDILGKRRRTNMAPSLTVADFITFLQTLDQNAYIMLSCRTAEECDHICTKENIRLGDVVHCAAQTIPGHPPGIMESLIYQTTGPIPALTGGYTIPEHWALEENVSKWQPVLERKPCVIIDLAPWYDDGGQT